ncbi:hypothetical protein N0V86_000588 [Didymella sp. IMI 355093]|nr:hypothetical protein N0V86_000588 [Didymella sp. IMI 355093]
MTHGSYNTHHHYYADHTSRHSNIDPRDLTTSDPPNGPPPGHTSHAQCKCNRALRFPGNALPMSSSSSSDNGLSMTSTDIAELLNVNLEERVPRVYERRGSELVNAASTLRHESIPIGVRLDGAAEGEVVPWWFACAGSKAVRRMSVGWAAYEADRSIKEDLGFKDSERRRQRRKNRAKRRESKVRESSECSGATEGSDVLEQCKRASEMATAARQDGTRMDEWVRADSRAAMFEQMEEFRKFCELQQCEDKSESTSVSELEDWFQWQKSETFRRAAVKASMGKTLDWERSKMREWADFKEWQKRRVDKNRQKDYIRTRGKEKAFIRRSKAKQSVNLSNLLLPSKVKKMGKGEVNDVEWIDVPSYYEDNGDWKWERRVRLL